MKAILILVLVLFFEVKGEKSVKLDEVQALNLQDFNEGVLVEVVQNASNRLNNLAKEYYNIKVIQKQKRYAYMKMMRISQKVIKILKKYQLIPNEESLIKSKIKPQFLSKKRSWSFSTIFVVYGNEEELQKCYIELVKLGVQRLNTKPTINFLNQKTLSMQVFNSAKTRLLQKLQKFVDVQIYEVISIQIKGIQVKNSDLIEQQIEEQFNQSEEVISEEDLIQINDEAGQPAQKTSSDIEMNIVFRVGKISENEQSQEDEDSINSQRESETDESSDEL